MKKILIGIGGEAGAGIMESGNLLAKYALKNGLYTFMASEYPSLIRGGHNFSVVHISTDEIHCLSQGIDLLIALNEETITLHWHELRKGSAVIYDSDVISLEKTSDDVILHGLPLTSIAKESGGPPIMRNTVAIGAAIAIIQGDFTVLEKILQDTFAKKGQEIIDSNVKAALKGLRYIQGQHDETFGFAIEHKTPNPENILINGNDAISIGAIRAGLKFAAIYPMTPTTSILEYLAANQNNYNMVIKEPEDEISAIIMSIGASAAGVRSLTATSGGGFCLMTEGMGMAGIAETPLVVVEGMRSGPSTAMPTKTEQSDLDFVLTPGHGEFPHVVLTPGDAGECLKETFNAFNIADKYQLPVVILTDKYLSSSISVMEKPNNLHWTIDRGKYAKESADYKRYQYSEDGISPRSLPGIPGMLNHFNSYEHDEAGHDNDDTQERINMITKRMKKIDTLAADLPEPVVYGPKEADITIIGWGSNKGIILDALKMLEEEGVKANYLHLLYVKPFPAVTVSNAIDEARESLIVENNYTGQMARYIRAATGRKIKHKLLKYDGNPFYPEEIIAKVKSILPTEKHQEASRPTPKPIEHQENHNHQHMGVTND